MSLNAIGSILQKYAPQSAIRKGVTSAMVVETANKTLEHIFGPDIVNHAQATHVRHRVLTIACLSSSAAQAIKMRENDLFKAIEEAIGAKEVVKLQFLS